MLLPFYIADIRISNLTSLVPVVNIFIFPNTVFILFYFDNEYVMKLHIKGIDFRRYLTNKRKNKNEKK